MKKYWFQWTARRLAAYLIAGVLLESALLLLLSLIMVNPEPPLVAALRGEPLNRISAIITASPPPSAIITASPSPPGVSIEQQRADFLAGSDTIYSVVHWPLDKPLLEGGGHVLAIPFRFWWVPVLIIFGIPAYLAIITVGWVFVRRRMHREVTAA